MGLAACEWVSSFLTAHQHIKGLAACQLLSFMHATAVCTGLFGHITRSFANDDQRQFSRSGNPEASTRLTGNSQDDLVIPGYLQSRRTMRPLNIGISSAWKKGELAIRCGCGDVQEEYAMSVRQSENMSNLGIIGIHYKYPPPPCGRMSVYVVPRTTA